MPGKPSPKATRQKSKSKDKPAAIKKIHKSFAENERNWRSLVENAPNYILILDAQGNIWYLNRPVPGLNLEKAMGQSIYDYIPRDDHNLVKKAMASACRKGEFGCYECRGPGPDGTFHWYETHLGPLKVNRETIGATLFSFDISDRKRAEEELTSYRTRLESLVAERTEALHRRNNELRRSEKRYRDLYESAPSAYLSIDTADGVILHCNPAATRLFGYPMDALAGMDVFELCADTPAGTPKAREIFSRFIEGEPLQDEELQIRRKDGQTAWINLSAVPVREMDGKIVESRAICVDISGHKRLEEQLLQAAKMEAIGTLAGGVAHDFNNLLTTIIGNAHMVLSELEESHPLREDVEDIKKAGERAANLTRQLLTFSRKQAIEPRILNLNAVVVEVQKMLRRLIGEDISLSVVLEPALYPVKVDPGQLEQVLMNLAVNARDAMPHGGKLTIETANADLTEAYFQQHALEPHSGSYVMICVRDTGVGMPKEVSCRVFEPFFTTKDRDKGTGLGLSSVYGIVKQNRGFIWVHSEPECGAVFKVYLPSAEGGPMMQPEDKALDFPLEGDETVLVVEDDKRLRNLARNILKKYGYRVLTAQDAHEALQVSETFSAPIQLMVTDVVMPGMNGRELARRLQPLRPEMRVLYMSGYADSDPVQHDVLDAELPFLEKPFTPERLAYKVRRMLEKKEEKTA